MEWIDWNVNQRTGRFIKRVFENTVKAVQKERQGMNKTQRYCKTVFKDTGNTAKFFWGGGRVGRGGLACDCTVMSDELAVN